MTSSAELLGHGWGELYPGPVVQVPEIFCGLKRFLHMMISGIIVLTILEISIH